jgi:hypothetical protein
MAVNRGADAMQVNVKIQSVPQYAGFSLMWQSQKREESRNLSKEHAGGFYTASKLDIDVWMCGADLMRSGNSCA